MTRTLPPTYVIPWPLRLLGAWRVLRRRPASCADDMLRMLAAAPIAPRIEGSERIPSTGPLLITHNHYCRPGLSVWWTTSLVFTAVAHRRGQDPIWMITSEWYYRDPLRSATLTPLTRWLFGRAAATWGFLLMPPDARELARRAAAVRQALQRAGEVFARGGALGIAPEGSGEMTLQEPPRGAGRFLLRLAKGAPILPVGLCEENGALVARFGTPYRLEAQPGEDKMAEDERIKTEVMMAIATLVPAAMHGPYRNAGGLPRRPDSR